MMKQNGFLETGDGHALYWRLSGAADGVPVILLHGGPGCSMDAYLADYFDLSKTRFLQFDQRGCGRSSPPGSLHNNTTAHLVSDIEALRHYHGFENPILCGGSWGSTLAIEYAKAYPEHVSKLLLNSVFLGRDADEDWFLNGVRALRPDAWNQLTDGFSEAEKANIGMALYTRAFSEDEDRVRDVVARFSNYMGTLLKLDPDLASPVQAEQVTEGQIAAIRIFLHYSSNHYFLSPDQGALAGLDRIAHIPLHIIHGRYDLDAPLIQSYDLHQAMPGSTLDILTLCGHSDTEAPMAEALKKLYQIS